MQTWLRVASIDPTALPPAGLSPPSSLSFSLYISGQESKGTESQVEWRAQKRCGKGRLPFLVLGAHLCLMDARGHPRGLGRRSAKIPEEPAIPRGPERVWLEAFLAKRQS